MGQGLILFLVYSLIQIVLWVAGAFGYLLGFLLVEVQFVAGFVFRHVKRLVTSNYDRQTD
jgi:UPF0716 family protein affecting phage T7 exclusion